MFEQRPKTCPIQAQSTPIATAMGSICNDKRVRFGVVSGHDRKTLSLSVPERISNLPEQHLKTRPIQAQTTGMAMAMVRISNDERVRFGVVSGQGRRALRLTPRTVEA